MTEDSRHFVTIIIAIEPPSRANADCELCVCVGEPVLGPLFCHMRVLCVSVSVRFQFIDEWQSPAQDI